jgi:general secretion pathway protein B
MSYILEALKRVEENRRRSVATSDLLDNLSETTAKSRRRPLWIYPLVFALLLNAGLLSWWLLPSKRQVSGYAHKEQASPSQPTHSVPANEPPLDPEYVRVGVSKTPLPPSASPLEVEGKRETTLPGEKNAVDDEQKVHDMNDLPAQARQDLPDITLSGHFYSANPSSRIVVLNGKTLREGQTAAGGIKLEQITSEGVIMSYQGYRFRKGVF